MQRATGTGQGPLGRFLTAVVAVTLLWWDVCPETLPEAAAACRHQTQALHESTAAASFLQTQPPRHGAAPRPRLRSHFLRLPPSQGSTELLLALSQPTAEPNAPSSKGSAPRHSPRAQH